LNTKIKALKKKKRYPQANLLKKDANSDSDSSGFAEGVFESCLAELEVNSLEDSPVWILDSGATQHVTGNPDILTNIKKVSHATPMLTAGRDSHNVAGRGKVLLKISDGSIKSIKNVHYVPGIRRDLLSIGCFTKQGYLVEFIKNTCLIKDMKTRVTLFQRSRLGKKGLYKLRTKCLLNTEVCSLEEQKDVEKAMLWHYRLGHLNFEALHKLSQQKTVKGLPTLPKLKIVCETCQKGKQTRKKFFKSLTTTSRPLQPGLSRGR
jgi:hypothetical protein